MKRLGNIYQQVISIDNLYAADAIAQRGKAKQPAVIKHMQNQDANIWQLHNALFDKNYRTSEYTTFKIHDPKEREVYRLPYFPDRIVHHAIMRVLEPMFKTNFTADTYSCIKGKGVHAASFALRRALKNDTETLYCLKFDIRKFYPSVNHDVLKTQLRRKIKDTDLLWLLDEIIDSAYGLPIGNYLSQYFANFYLSGFDHWIKETKRVKYYFRYADDVVILAPNKPYLHDLFSEITVYLSTNLKLAVKRNCQVFPVSARGIDFVGYKHYHTHTLLRKSIKKRFARMLKNRRNKQSIASYYGWAKHCNSTNLLNKLLNHDQKI